MTEDKNFRHGLNRHVYWIRGNYLSMYYYTWKLLIYVLLYVEITYLCILIPSPRAFFLVKTKNISAEFLILTFIMHYYTWKLLICVLSLVRNLLIYVLLLLCTIMRRKNFAL